MTDDFHEKLRKIRVVHNYSQEYVAETIGVSVSSYARYEAKKVEIDFHSVYKLAQLYKLTLDELYNYGDPSFNLSEPKESYMKRWSIPVTVALDGTEETLSMWIKKITAINQAI